MASRLRTYSLGRPVPPDLESGKDRIEVDYEAMRKFGKSFQNEGDDLTKLYFVTNTKLDGLKRDWIGRGSESFFHEMENTMMPSFDRLCKALIDAAQAANKVSRLFSDAEETARGDFLKSE